MSDQVHTLCHSWVRVSERLPEEDTYVLAVEPAARPIEPFVPVVARYTTTAGRHLLATAWIDSTGEYIDVSHWMPLPPAPGLTVPSMSTRSAFTFPDEPTPDHWQRIHSRDELEAFYHHILPRVRAAARKCGYAVGLHGSMRRDLDLIAVPWVADHADKDALATAIQRAACGIVSSRYEWGALDKKPCGRQAVSIPICWTEGAEFPHDEKSTGHIDLSVMPAALPENVTCNVSREGNKYAAVGAVFDKISADNPSHTTLGVGVVSPSSIPGQPKP